MKIEFREKNHDYVRNGIYYTPVSNVIKRFVPDFDADFVAGKVANRDGREKKEVLDEWDLKKNIACDFGNAIHQSAELWIKYGVKPKNYLIEKLIDDFPLDRNHCHSEEMVFDDDLLIAGTIDIPYERFNASNSSTEKIIDLYDIKTNRNLEKNHGRLLEPFNDLPNSKLSKYRLQLTIYKMLYENLHDDAKVEDLYIAQLDLEELSWNIIKVEPVAHDMRKIIGDLELKVEKEERDIIKDLV